MNELIVINDSCSYCGVALTASDNFCGNCGTPQSVSEYPPAGVTMIDAQRALTVVPPSPSTLAPRPVQSLITEFLDNRLFVTAILLCAGPIGLPALWFSHRFSRRCKIITTTGYFFFTVILPLAIAWYFLDVAVRPIVDALS